MVEAATWGLLALGLLVGAVSALTPFLPAEAFVISVAVAQEPVVALGCALTAALGQTAGKLALFGATRSAGRSGLIRRLRDRSAQAAAARVPVPSAGGDVGGPSPAADDGAAGRRIAGGLGRACRRLNDAGIALLDGPSGSFVVLVSGGLGLPPLLAVTFYAGASRMSARTFTGACLTGRAIRFVAIALLPDLL